ncbi:MAG: hypothetical protein OD918_02480 [Gammaproteobacteria bacterium]
MKASAIISETDPMPTLFDFHHATPCADIVLAYILRWACPQHRHDHHALHRLGEDMVRAILDATVDDESMKKRRQPECFATVLSTCWYEHNGVSGGYVELTVDSPAYPQSYRGPLHNCQYIYVILKHDADTQWRKKSGARGWRGWDVSIAYFGFCDGGDDFPVTASSHGLFLEKNVRAVFRKHPPTGDAAIDAYRNYLLRGC